MIIFQVVDSRMPYGNIGINLADNHLGKQKNVYKKTLLKEG